MSFKSSGSNFGNSGISHESIFLKRLDFLGLSRVYQRSQLKYLVGLIRYLVKYGAPKGTS